MQYFEYLIMQYSNMWVNSKELVKSLLWQWQETEEEWKWGEST